MDLHELNPPTREIHIASKRYDLKFITFNFLRAAKKHFGSVENYHHLLDKCKSENGVFDFSFMSTVVWTAFQLIDYPNFKDFSKRFIKDTEEYHRNVLIIFKVFEDSTPLKTGARGKEGGEPNFSRSYVFVAKELGMTIPQFYEHTPRQIDQIQKDLVLLRQEDMRFQASLNGVKLKEEKAEKVTFTDKENREFEAEAQRTLRRLKNGKSNTK